MDPNRPLAPDPYSRLPHVPSFTVTSDDITDDAPLPAPQTAAGGSTSPHLTWAGFPESTRSFAITCFDPDAPGAGFCHWSVIDVPATTTSLPRGASSPTTTLLPFGAIPTRTDEGTTGYFGAAPPRGDRPHRYCFAVHALDVDHLDAPPSAQPAAVASAVALHTVARATLTPIYAG